MSFKPVKNIAFVALASIILSACNLMPNFGNSNKQVNLKFWGIWESPNVVNQLINDYKKTHPNVTIVYEQKSVEQYRESLQTQIQSGKGPDVFVFHNTWVPMLGQELAEIPAKIITQADVKKDYYPTILNDLRNSNKQLVGLPSGIDGLGLYWNQDLFNAAGITTPPSTWQELSQDAAKLTVKGPDGSIKTAGAALGTAANIDHFSDILGMMILQNQGDIKNPTDQRSADTLDYYIKFAKGDNRVWDDAQPSSTIAFTGGHLAMYFGPSWRAAEVKTQNPALNFKIAPVPQLTSSNKVTWASYWAFGVSSKSQNQEEAWQFVKFLEEDQSLIKLYAESAKEPGRIFGEPYPKISLAASLSTDPYVGAFIQDAQFMQSFPMASRTYDNGLNDKIIQSYQTAVTGAVTGKTPSQAALKTAAAEIAQTFLKYTQPQAK